MNNVLKEAQQYQPPRPLYEQLQEQKLKQEEEFQENRKFGNLIRKVNEDEYEYLMELERELYEKEKELWLQDQEEVQRFRHQVKQFEEQQQQEKVEEKEEKEITLKHTHDINSNSSESSSLSLSAMKETRVFPIQNVQKTILCSSKMIKIKPKLLPIPNELATLTPSSSSKSTCHSSTTQSNTIGIIDYEESDLED
jgi:hypothetical protein